MVLSDEQNTFISKALFGNNILVDACIGSGKTTAIQYLCNTLPSTKKVLYLTYNRLLKVDAISKIKQKNVMVTNYHGFAYRMLNRYGIPAGVSDLIQTFIKYKPSIPKFDVLIIDEYQDIDLELSQLLEYIKQMNAGMQIVAVGDMEQKIYDKTTLDAQIFIRSFLEEYEQLYFTKCFRLSNNLASKLGQVWKKKIVGVNEECIVEKKAFKATIDVLKNSDPKDILCLGVRTGDMARALNVLERDCPEKFNKNTVYASIQDRDDASTEPDSECAIFTTYDSCKGLERNICVVFDFTDDYWDYRVSKPDQKYTILRNIFCVALSRGKSRIILVKNECPFVTIEKLSTPVYKEIKKRMVGVKELFDFKYKEDVEECYNLLQIEKVPTDDTEIINIKPFDGLIDISPCIGEYQEASFFADYDVDKEIELLLLKDSRLRSLYGEDLRNSSCEKKILFFTSLETRQFRYYKQVDIPYVYEAEKESLKKRLSERLTPNEKIQVISRLDVADSENGAQILAVTGYADVVKDNVVYELKFVTELQHEHFLQCAMYMVMLGLPEGILWNTKKNEIYRIRISNTALFLNHVVKTATKGVFCKYYKYNGIIGNDLSSTEKKSATLVQKQTKNNNSKDKIANEHIAIIDTETNILDQVISIGLVIADYEKYEIADEYYFVLTPECNQPSMYSQVLWSSGCKKEFKGPREKVLNSLVKTLETYEVKSIFAYNANFDQRHLNELNSYEWLDIMKVAAYKQYNKAITEKYECFGTGKLKRNFGVQNIYKMLSGDIHYMEIHNALRDARDELKIMKMLALPVSTYKEACYSNKGNKNNTSATKQMIQPKKVASKNRSENSLLINQNNIIDFLTLADEQKDTIRNESSTEKHIEKNKQSDYLSDNRIQTKVTVEQPKCPINTPVFEKMTQNPNDFQYITKASKQKKKTLPKTLINENIPANDRITISEASVMLGCSIDAVIELVKNGEIFGYMQDDTYILSKASVEKKYASNQTMEALAIGAVVLVFVVVVCFIIIALG